MTTLNRPIASIFLAALCFCISALNSSRGAIPATDSTRPASTPSPLYQQIVDEYLDVKWDALRKDIVPGNKALVAFSQAEKVDVNYIRGAVSDCEPDWWAKCKLNKRFGFHALVWGRQLSVIFDPDGKTEIQLRYMGDNVLLTIKWNTQDMDNAADAEHGFTKGDLQDVGIWLDLGNVEAWGRVSPEWQVNLKDDQKILLGRYLDSRGNFAALRYATPRARRWCAWLCLAAYEPQYAEMRSVMARKAVASALMMEIVSHPARYPSITLPASLAEKDTEAALAAELKQWMEAHRLTLAEDRALRELALALAGTNDKDVLKSGLVKLPGGLIVALDPDQDKVNQPKRDAALRAAMEHARK